MTKVKFKDGHSVSQEPMLYFPFSMSRKVNLGQKLLQMFKKHNKIIQDEIKWTFQLQILIFFIFLTRKVRNNSSDSSNDNLNRKTL